LSTGFARGRFVVNKEDPLTMKTLKGVFLRRAATAAFLLAVVILFSSCLPGDGKNNAEKPANFLMGIWHGWVAPVSVIVGIFKGNIRVYEANNSGWWYDLGFYMAIISGFGGITLSRKARRERHT
jgi:hypothetical protein